MSPRTQRTDQAGVLHLDRVTSGTCFQRVALTPGPGGGAVLRVTSLVSGRSGGRWAEATLGPEELGTLREWLGEYLEEAEARSERP